MDWSLNGLNNGSRHKASMASMAQMASTTAQGLNGLTGLSGLKHDCEDCSWPKDDGLDCSMIAKTALGGEEQWIATNT